MPQAAVQLSSAPDPYSLLQARVSELTGELAVVSAQRMAELAEKKDKPQKRVNPLEVDYLADTEKQLTSALGRRTQIRDSGKKGKIEMEYYGTDDREALIAALLQPVLRRIRL